MTAANPTAESAISASPTKLVAAPRRVLIILLGAIGDVVRALPLLGRIRSAWPAAHIAWAVEPKSQAVLEGHPWLDELIIYNRRVPLSFLPFLARVRAGHFDLVLDLQRHLKSGVVSIASGARVRVGFDRSNSKEFNHLFSTRQIAPQPPMRLKLMQYQAFGDALGLPPCADGVRLALLRMPSGRAWRRCSRVRPAAAGGNPGLVMAEPDLFSRLDRRGDS